MKGTFKVNPNLVVELEANDSKDMFGQLAQLSEIFGHNACGKCGCTDVKPQVRVVGKYKYHELKCTKCHATLSFGQKEDDGSLFPKRYEGEGENKKWLPNDGWTVYNKQNDKKE